jgi:hypothetical protein
MALTNLGELKTAIATRLSRSDLTSEIPDFITIARHKMMLGDYANDIPAVRIDDMLTVEESLTLATGVADLSGLANTYLQRHSLYIDDTDETPLNFMPVARFNRLGSKTQSGTPQFYTVYKKKLQVAPYSSQDIKFTYYSEPTAMSDDSDTDVILTKAPHAYLYGAVAEAYAKIRQFQNAQLYMSQFRSAVISLNEDSDNEEFSGDSIAMYADRVA